MTDAPEIKATWKYYRDGKASDPCAAERDHGIKKPTLKQFARAEAYHASYSNFGMQCRFWLTRKGNRVVSTQWD